MSGERESPHFLPGQTVTLPLDGASGHTPRYYRLVVACSCGSNHEAVEVFTLPSPAPVRVTPGPQGQR